MEFQPKLTLFAATSPEAIVEVRNPELLEVTPGDAA
jgi:hypothetical protein